ncbi:hypothetical protein V8E55_001516 [Tylopilus felleus]
MIHVSYIYSPICMASMMNDSLELFFLSRRWRVNRDLLPSPFEREYIVFFFLLIIYVWRFGARGVFALVDLTVSQICT